MLYVPIGYSFGMLYVPIGYSFGAGMFNLESTKGGTLYGAGVFANGFYLLLEVVKYPSATL